MDTKVIAGLSGIAVFSLAVIYWYNKLIRLRLGTKNAWSDVDVLLKKRYDLLPNLVETVKGYAGHEQGTLRQVTEVRARAMAADGRAEKAQAENMLTQTLKSLFALAEAYPQLKADAHFRDLMANNAQVEAEIEHARRFYNAAVRDYNVATEVFPLNVIAAAFAFRAEEFFSLGEESEARQPVKVKFGA